MNGTSQYSLLKFSLLKAKTRIRGKKGEKEEEEKGESKGNLWHLTMEVL